MKLKFIVALFFVIIFFLFCKKAEPVKTPVNVSEEIKAYGYFKPGSYWIYRDSATGILDSTYATEIVRGESETKNSEQNISVVETFTVYSRSDSSGYSPVKMSGDKGDRMFINGTDNFLYHVFDADINNVSSEIGKGISKHELLSNYTILNHNYTDIHIVSYIHEVYSRYGTYWISGKNYWRKNIGIIKKYKLKYVGGGNSVIVSGPQELLRYHIVQ